jgi:CheY-like chemotaxis protein
VERDGASGAPEGEREVGGAAASDGRILVVDDTLDLREAIGDLLRDEGFAVSLAANGREALALLATEPPPDVALVDLLMPEMDGASFVERLRADPAFARVKIMVVTAVASPHVPRLVPADAHVFKPFDARELVDAVRRLLPGRAS